MGKNSFSVTTKVTPDSLKEPRSKAFEAWAVSFCEAQPAMTDKAKWVELTTEIDWV
jgi:hypothetical protein